MKYLCFQLWGTDPTYVQGFYENLRQARRYYPGYQVLLYKEQGVPGHFPCEVIERADEGWLNFFWRLHIFRDRQFEVVHFRDADSRLNCKEAKAVKHWEATKKTAYTMHDNPAHADPVMAGMWGIKGGVLPDQSDAIAEWLRLNPAGLKYGCDQRFLHALVLPTIRNSLIRYGRYTKFPSADIDTCRFIGEKIIVPPTDDSGTS